MRTAYAVVLTALLCLVITATAASGCADRASPAIPSLQPTTLSVAATSPTVTAADSSEAKRRLTQERILAAKARQAAQAATAGTAVTDTTAPSGSGPRVTPPLQRPSTQGGYGSPTSVVLSGGRTPLTGVWSGSAERLASFLLNASPMPRFTVPVGVLADYYVRYSSEAGLRADLLWAQMIHETGYGKYGGDVAPEQNNYAGVGATGGGAAGVAFTSAETGVMAHVAHMVAYVYTSSPAPWAGTMVDPRFDLVAPRGVATVLSDLDGRWAVPGEGYGERIETIARAINAG